MKNKHHSQALFTLVLSCLLLLEGMSSSLSVRAVTLESTLKTTGYNNPIVLSGLVLKGLNPETSLWESVTQMTPTQNVKVEFKLEDFDGLDHVLIEVALVHDEDGVAADQSDITATFENLSGISESAEEFDFYWNPSLTEGPQLALSNESVTTSWVLVSSNVSDLPQGALDYTFSFEFTVSKAAKADGNWMLNVRVMDDYRDQPTIPPTMAQDRLENLNVQWYGEVRNLGASALDFGTLSAGMTYGDPKAKTQVGLSFLSNGSYEQLVHADRFWKGTQISDTALGVDLETFNAELVDDPDLIEQSFGIRLNPVDSLEKGYMADYLQLTSQNKVLGSSAIKTGELGTRLDLNLYLHLSDRFQNGSYSGSIRFGIGNLLN